MKQQIWFYLFQEYDIRSLTSVLLHYIKRIIMWTEEKKSGQENLSTKNE
jgi:hypothetical protein